MAIDLKLIPRPSNDHYELVEDFEITVVGKPLWVPSGFHYDGASIPAPAWPMTYTPFAPDVMRAAIVHDWLYHAHDDEPDDSERRKFADEMLFQILRADGVGTGKAKLMWMAVRTFGAPAWGNDEGDRDIIRAIYERHKGEAGIEKFGFPRWLKP